MVKALKEYLARFIELTEEEFDDITHIAEVRTYDKKVKLIDHGEHELYFNFIVKGLARKYFYKGDEEIITQLAKELQVGTGTIREALRSLQSIGMIKIFWFGESASSASTFMYLSATK